MRVPRTQPALGVCSAGHRPKLLQSRLGDHPHPRPLSLSTSIRILVRKARTDKPKVRKTRTSTESSGRRLRGDFNHNGVVDAADDVLWRNSNGPSGIDGLVPADRFFHAAPEILSTLKERVTANALEAGPAWCSEAALLEAALLSDGPSPGSMAANCTVRRSSFAFRARWTVAVISRRNDFFTNSRSAAFCSVVKLLDRPGGRDVIGRDRVAEQGKNPGAGDRLDAGGSAGIPSKKEGRRT